MKIKLFLILLLFTAAIEPVFAGGLSTACGEILLKDIPQGKAFSTPLIVDNTSSQEINLLIEVLLPESNELKKGYVPLPDINWITLTQNKFTVKPNESAKTDVIITIPKGKQFAGKKYQVYVWSHTTGTAVGVGLKSRLLFSVENNKESG